jgi:hypothetical protein
MKASEDLTDAPMVEGEASAIARGADVDVIDFTCITDPPADYTDGAAFDEVEALARQLCAASGRGWDTPRTKRGHWRKKARAVLVAERAKPREPWWRRVLRWATTRSKARP